MAIRTQKTAAWVYRTYALNSNLSMSVGLKNFGKNFDSYVLSERDQIAVDAAELMDQWYVGWSAVGLPILNVRWSGPIDLETPFGDHETPPMLKKHLRSFKPQGWRDERYLKAIQKVRSLLADWDWIVEQHEAGAEFGARVCRQEPKLSLDFGDRFCKLPKAKPSQDRQKALPSGRAD